MKLKIKILLAVVLLPLFINIISMTIYIQEKENNLLKRLNLKIENTSHLLKQVNSAPLYNLNLLKIQINLKSFLKDPDIVFIKLEDKKTNINMTFQDKNFNKNKIIKKESIITQKKEYLGTITTYYTTKNIEQSLSKSINQVFKTFIIVTILISLTLYILLNRFTKPITQLTKLSSEIANGNLDKSINIDSKDEIGTLAESFEYMRVSLKTRINLVNKQKEEIEKFNDKLQRKIDERTKELLEQKNIFETLFNDTSDALVLVKDNKFIDCNSAALKLLDYKDKKKLMNIHPSEISPKYQPDGELSTKKEALLIKECMDKGQVKFEWIHINSNQDKIWIDVLLTKIVINHENIIYAVWRDITDKKLLEKEIQTRNNELEHSNNELENSLNNLKQTQNKLIESEKMASLGMLVAGVAHEINTPIGLGITSMSHFVSQTSNLKELYEQKLMEQNDFENYLENTFELGQITYENLKRAAHLVKSFKQISIDQVDEHKREFNLKKYIEETILSLHNKIKKSKIKVNIYCSDELIIFSYPGAFSQIITNLIMNSLIHGYKENDSGVITLHFEKNDSILKFIYKDDGKGIKKDNLNKIFDPFFTTNRAHGGSGLGLNIIYNIVSTQLEGTIKCNSKIGEGTEFIMEISC